MNSQRLAERTLAMARQKTPDVVAYVRIEFYRVKGPEVPVADLLDEYCQDLRSRTFSLDWEFSGASTYDVNVDQLDHRP